MLLRFGETRTSIHHFSQDRSESGAILNFESSLIVDGFLVATLFLRVWIFLSKEPPRSYFFYLGQAGQSTFSLLSSDV
jgi:hypothetical protein